MKSELGLVEIDYSEFAVEDLSGWSTLLETNMGIPAVQHSEKAGRKSTLHVSGDVRILLSESTDKDSEVSRFLQIHPEGLMTIALKVSDINRAYQFLESRNATIVDRPIEEDGTKWFEITSPIGDIVFRFVERSVELPTQPLNHSGDQKSPAISIPWQKVDHVTINSRSVLPVANWFRDVLGLEMFFEGQMHTGEDSAGVIVDSSSGTGFKWMALWDPSSGIKFSTNEPLRPNFRASQTDRFIVDNRGAGVQHLALEVPSILDAVDTLTKAGFEFHKKPARYYQQLAARLDKAGADVDAIKESIDELAKRSILVDGSSKGYMLQIFQQELRLIQDKPEGSPFFFEVIQRAGDEGFGFGTFRALFEAIESSQIAAE